MKKILISIFFISLLLTSTVNVTAYNIPKIQKTKQLESNDEFIERFLEITEDEENTSTLFRTAGPRNLLNFRMKIENGSIIDRYAIIETLLLNVVIRALFLYNPIKLLRPFIYVISEQGKIDFTLEYKRDIPEGNSSRYKYWTQYGGYKNNSFTNESTSIYNKKHKVRVEGFYGAIFTTKRTFLLPPIIVMSGRYDKITLIEQ